MYRVFDIAMCVGENYAFYVSHDSAMASCGFACLRVVFFFLFLPTGCGENFLFLVAWCLWRVLQLHCTDQLSQTESV